MMPKLIEDLLKKEFSVYSVKREDKGIRSSCPLAPFKSEHKSYDKHPSMFIYSTSIEEDKESYCFCHTCQFKGSMRDLAGALSEFKEFDHQALSKKIHDYEINNLETVPVDLIIPEYHEIPNIVKYNKAAAKNFKRGREVYHQFIIAPNDEEIQIIYHGEEVPALNEHQIKIQIEPYLKTVPKYIIDRKFHVEHCRKWGLGFQKKLLYKTVKNGRTSYYDFGDRLLISIKDIEGHYVGWSSRSIIDEKDVLYDKSYRIDDKGRNITTLHKNKKYRHMKCFQRDQYLYGENFIDKNVPICILSEGFFDVMRIDQAGYKNALAVMGTHLSKDQVKKILHNFNRVILFMDGDKAGEEAAEKITYQLKDSISVSKVDFSLYEGKDPGDLTEDEIHNILQDHF